MSATKRLRSGMAGTRHGADLEAISIGLGVPDKVIQTILRHSNVNVTLACYVKSASSDVLGAMGRFEQESTVQKVQDTDRTVKPDSGATPEFVN